MLNYITGGQVEAAPPEDPTSTVFYLPQQAVKKEKHGKINWRIVFNASSHEANAPSFNDVLDVTKMADVVCGTKCCATNPLNCSTSNGFRDCAKCAELAIQLQQVREELSSVQLIIQLLNQERVQGTTVTPPIQVTETKGKVDKNWQLITQRGAKKKGRR
jgi:hypothetical protein